MTIQHRIVELVAPEYVRKMAEQGAVIAQAQNENLILRDSLETFVDMLRDRVISVRDPGTMIQEMQEQGYDSGMIQLLVDQIGWETITSLSAVQDDDSRERDMMVDQAERLFRYSPLAQWSIWLWTGWGLGDKITVTLEKDTAQKWWDEFVTAERNEPVMGEDIQHELSDWTLVKGNRFIALFTATTGKNKGLTTVRILDQKEVTLICNPEDKKETWFYARAFTNGNAVGGDEKLYYPDYRTALGDGDLVGKRWKILQDKKVIDPKAKRADEAVSGTTACVFHIAHNRKNETSPWGWPITTAAGAWVKGHKQFSEARLGVAMAIAQFVRRSRVKGGSRAVASVIGQIASTLSRTNYLETNPPAAAGAHAVENQAVETKELPMRTGGADAKSDNEMFSWMALLGMGLFPTSAGLDTSRWATAVEMDKAQSMQFERYQRFWNAKFRRLVRLVLMLGDKYGPASFTDEDTKAEISTDTFSLSDYPAVSSAVAAQVEKMLVPFIGTGIIPEEAMNEIMRKLWEASLSALGSGFARDLTSEEAFTVTEEPPKPASPPATGDDEDETEPGMESDYIRTLDVALQSLDNGDITKDQWAEMMVAEIGEVYVEHGQNTSV